MTIELIIFDLDDTLLPELPPVEEAFIATAAKVHSANSQQLAGEIKRIAKTLWYDGPWHEYGTSLGISWWEGLSASFEGEGPNLPAMKAWCMPYRVQAWREALASCGINDGDLGQQLADFFPKDKEKRITAYEGAHAVVDELAANYRVAMLTNGIPDLQHEKIRRSNFTGRFDPLVISGVVGIGKPDARVFQHLLREANVTNDRALMVGNSLKSDIAGARNANVASVWIDHDHEGAPDDCKPTATIHDIRELPDAVRTLQ